MGRCMLGGLLIFVAMSLGTEAGGFAPSTPSDAGAAAGGLDAAAIAARHGPAQILSRRHGTAVSLNWAGYAASGTTFTDVKGTWTLPAVTCSKNQLQIASFWVGIDGFTSSNVIPLSVNPGDTVSAEVSASGTAFTLTITVGTQQFSTTQMSAVAAKELGRMDRRGAVAGPRRLHCGVLLRRIRERRHPCWLDHGPGLGQRRDRHGHAFAKDQGPAVLPPQRRHGLYGGLAAQVA